MHSDMIPIEYGPRGEDLEGAWMLMRQDGSDGRGCWGIRGARGIWDTTDENGQGKGGWIKPEEQRESV